MTTELERLVIRLVGGKKKFTRLIAWVTTVICIEHITEAAFSTQNWLAAFFALTTAWFAWNWHWDYPQDD